MEGEVITRALSLTQPWASLVVHGLKGWETRGWRTNWRGWVGIHAAKSFPMEFRFMASQDPTYRAALESIGGELPLGALLGFARIADVHGTEAVRQVVTAREVAFGDYGPRRYAFALEDVRRLLEPVPMRGRLNLWPMPEPVLVRDLARLCHPAPPAPRAPYPFCSHPARCADAGRCARIVRGEPWVCNS